MHWIHVDKLLYFTRNKIYFYMECMFVHIEEDLGPLIMIIAPSSS